MKKIYFFIMLALGISSVTSQGGENDLYEFHWLDPDKKVYVLQNKAYAKKNRFYGNFGFLKNISSDYTNTYGAQFKTGYYFFENWAVEGFYQRYQNSTNATYQNLNKVNGVEPFLRTHEQTMGVLGIWSPFYGKINTFNKIIYFDWSFGLGVAKIDTESNAKSATDPKSKRFEKEEQFGGVAKTSLRFHINKKTHIDLDLSNTFYQADGPIKSKGPEWNNSTDAIISIGLSF